MPTESHKESSIEAEVGDIESTPGSRPWAVAVARKLRSDVINYSNTANNVSFWLQQAIKHEAWKPLGYRSYDLWLRMKVQINTEQANAILNADPKALLSEIPELRKHGRPSGEEKGDNVTFPVRGNNVQYALARLKRDNPGLAEEVLSGAMSANAAAIAAGFRKKTCTVVVGDAQAAARTLLKHYPAADLIKAIKDQVNC